MPRNVETPWKWDPTLFAGAARYYERGRLPYAPGLAAALADSLALDGAGRLLDIGCGPGTVALLVAGWFQEVVGLDPDPDMLREAERLATARGVRNARWVLRRGEELDDALGPFRVATFAQSLHWLDQPLVFSRVRSLLESDGAVVHVDTAPEPPPGPGDWLPHPAPPDKPIADLRDRFLGSDVRAGQGVRNASPDGEDEVFRAVGFVGPERVRVPDGRILERSVDDLVAETFSRSSSAPHLFGDRLSEFESELRALLARASPSGSFSIRRNDTVLKIWRPA